VIQSFEEMTDGQVDERVLKSGGGRKTESRPINYYTFNFNKIGYHDYKNVLKHALNVQRFVITVQLPAFTKKM